MSTQRGYLEDNLLEDSSRWHPAPKLTAPVRIYGSQPASSSPPPALHSPVSKAEDATVLPSPLRRNHDEAASIATARGQQDLTTEVPARRRQDTSAPLQSAPRHQTSSLPTTAPPAYEAAEMYRTVIGFDFGTTFTGVAFATASSHTAELDAIHIVSDWGRRMGSHFKIPSVISYSPAPNGEQQWGTDISQDAVTMVNTKLELETQDNKVDELDLILQLLNGVRNLAFENVKLAAGYPEYTWKSPTEIVADYLTKVLTHVYDAADLSNVARSENPIDIVLTVPVNWSYRATNSTLKALRQAMRDTGFPSPSKMILVSEPEAAAIFITRYLKEQRDRQILRQGECFVVCDAGGGTVDVVAYQVKQLQPTLEIVKITVPTSDKCGATYINTFFKRWLRKLIGEDRFRALDPSSEGQRISSHTTESGQMRELIRAFEEHKKAFSNAAPVMKLDMPHPLQSLTHGSRLKDGELTIHPDDMRGFFNPCVERVVELISGQRAQIERRRYRLKNVFLVGGFGESGYLQEELKKSLDMRKINLVRPDEQKSWTAVVQGSVMYGIERSRPGKSKQMATMSGSFGIVTDRALSLYNISPEDVKTDPITGRLTGRRQFAWMIHGGDLVYSDEETQTEQEFPFSFDARHSQKFTLPIYTYPFDDGDEPDRWETGQHEVNVVCKVDCNFAQVSKIEFDQRANPTTGETYYSTQMVCRMLFTLTKLTVHVLLNNNPIGSASIQISDDMAGNSGDESPILRPLATPVNEQILERSRRPYGLDSPSDNLPFRQARQSTSSDHSTPRQSVPSPTQQYPGYSPYDNDGRGPLRRGASTGGRGVPAPSSWAAYNGS